MGRRPPSSNSQLTRLEELGSLDLGQVPVLAAQPEAAASRRRISMYVDSSAGNSRKSSAEPIFHPAAASLADPELIEAEPSQEY